MSRELEVLEASLALMNESAAKLGASMTATGDIDPVDLAVLLRHQQALADALDQAAHDLGTRVGYTLPEEDALYKRGVEAFFGIYGAYRLRIAQKTGTTRPFAHLLGEIQAASRSGAL